MGCSTSTQILPYMDNTKQHANEYISMNSNKIIKTLNNCRNILHNTDELEEMALKTESLIDIVILAIYKTIVTTEIDFKLHYKLCCCLMYNSSQIITRLYEKMCRNTKIDIDSIDIDINNPFEHADSLDVAYDTDLLITLIKKANVIQSHPLLDWDIIITDSVPEDEIALQIYGLFKMYCTALYNYIQNCTNIGNMPPQAEFRNNPNKNTHILLSNAYVEKFTYLYNMFVVIISICRNIDESSSLLKQPPKSILKSESQLHFQSK